MQDMVHESHPHADYIRLGSQDALTDSSGGSLHQHLLIIQPLQPSMRTFPPCEPSWPNQCTRQCLPISAGPCCRRPNAWTSAELTGVSPARSGASSSRQSSSGKARESAPAWQIWSSLWILILLASSSGSTSSSTGASPWIRTIRLLSHSSVIQQAHGGFKNAVGSDISQQSALPAQVDTEACQKQQPAADYSALCCLWSLWFRTGRGDWGGMYQLGLCSQIRCSLYEAAT